MIDKELLRRMWEINKTPLEIAIRMNCTVSGVRQAAKKLGLQSQRTATATARSRLSKLEEFADGLTNYGE
jgi:hypothetical protein